MNKNYPNQSCIEGDTHQYLVLIPDTVLVGNVPGTVPVPGTRYVKLGLRSRTVQVVAGADLYDRWIVCRNQNVKCVLTDTTYEYITRTRYSRLCGRCLVPGKVYRYEYSC